ncbi:MAG: TraB/GumN family protein [Pseudomonadales bacterium]|nr:TraB/GumN family protein [Pseudomonadales bacterium]
MMNYPLHLLKVFIFSTLLAMLNTSYAQENRGFIWEVEFSGKSLYLLGSIHFANADFYPLRKEIEIAFAKSDHLAVEVDIATVDPIQTQAYLFEIGTYPAGETIRDHIDPTTFRLLEQHLSKRHLPTPLFLQYKPGMLVMSLTSLELINLGLSPDQGLDLHFLSRARGNKTIVELETLEQQLDLLVNMRESQQMLRQTLEEFEEYPQLMTSLVDIWKRGDTEQLNDLLIEKPLRDFPDSRPVFEKMFIQRNKQMVEKIKSFLHTNNRYFVVVGAGHLIGNHGIVDLLQKAGYKVRPL